jgi:imidazolonepropionase-like amidohydrolase
MTTAIFASRLIDGTGAEPVTDSVVVLEGERVVAAGRRAQVKVQSSAEAVDAEGLTLLPGLIDTHVHLLSPGTGVDYPDLLSTPPSLRLLRAVAAMRATLEAGFTTVRDAGGSPAGLRKAVEQGVVPGPRVQVAVSGLSQTGGHGDQHMACGINMRVVLPDVPIGIVDGVEPMRQRVREVMRAGADWIKIHASGGVMSPSDSPGDVGFTVEEIRAAVEEAAAHGGKRVMAHAQAARGIKNALRAGVVSIEHGVWLDDESIALLLENDAFLVPTLVAPLWVSRHAAAGRVPPWAEQKARVVSADHRASISRAVRAGVKVAFGTDTGVGPHGSNGEEFARLVEVGMSPMAAIRSATAVAAELLRWEDRIGTIVAGKLADLIGVEGNPLDDIALLGQPARVGLVVRGGNVVKNLRVPQPQLA